LLNQMGLFCLFVAFHDGPDFVQECRDIPS
jgi:hypothetical protein